MEWLVNHNLRPVLHLGVEDEWDMVDPWERLVIEDSILRMRGRDANQVDFLSYFMGINYLDRINYIIRMEELQDGFRQLPFVQRRIKIPWRNTSGRKKNWRDCMNKNIEELIYEWAKPDFDAFNYGRETF